MVGLYRNGWFLEQGKPFAVFRERNIVTTKALFDFFDTMQDWNTVAMNLIWCRRNINEYQFWHLITLLVTHNRHFNNLVLPPYYEVLPTQFFTSDVIDQAMDLQWNYEHGSKQLVVMSNYSNGLLGSFDNYDNLNKYDLNDVSHGYGDIHDWSDLKKVMYDIQHQLAKPVSSGKNKDTVNKVFNNQRNFDQGKFEKLISNCSIS